ncbi:hypothetical protein R6Q57_030186 [Mikania cordata]
MHQEVSDLFGLLNLIHDHPWDSGVDSWKWRGGGRDQLSVYSAKKFISSRDYGHFFKMKWNGWILLKCNIMSWHVEQYRLSTRLELVKRGMNLQDVLCPLRKWS